MDNAAFTRRMLSNWILGAHVSETSTSGLQMVLVIDLSGWLLSSPFASALLHMHVVCCRRV